MRRIVKNATYEIFKHQKKLRTSSNQRNKSNKTGYDWKQRAPM